MEKIFIWVHKVITLHIFGTTMNPMQKLEYCYRVLEFLNKLLFRDFHHDNNRLIYKFITCSVIALVINYIYTIGFYEKDPFYIIIDFAYLSAEIQVGSIRIQN